MPIARVSRTSINKMIESWRDKTILITGASGIAAATARLAGLAGARVIVLANIEEQCRELAEALRREKIEISYVVADLTIESEAVAAVNECRSHYNRIDALFNVAGISGRRFGDGPTHECTFEGWRKTMRTNVDSTFLMCREVTKVMLEQQPDAQGMRGAILNMASVLAFSPESAHFATHAYAASKGAIVSLTRAMASYYAPHKIRVNAIAPGLTRTPMSARAQSNPEILELMKTKQPLREDLIEAEEIARAALFLLSDDARSITGDVLTVDAGWRVS